MSLAPRVLKAWKIRQLPLWHHGIQLIHCDHNLLNFEVRSYLGTYWKSTVDNVDDDKFEMRGKDNLPDNIPNIFFDQQVKYYDNYGQSESCYDACEL
jgi:hypothetical protein